jgi:hypothetical protein
MKNLLYKEFKLAVHPLIYLFIPIFALTIITPAFPPCVMFVYVVSCYTILFLGANKGQQSNDLLYSALLPIRKKDIVKARIFTCIFIHLLFLAITLALLPMAINSHNDLVNIAISEGTAYEDFGYSVNQFLAVAGFSIIGYGIVDIIYFAIYYKKGKSIVASTLISGLAMFIFVFLTTAILPQIDSLKPFFFDLICKSWWSQIIFFAICACIAGGLNYIAYRVGSKQLEKVDF